MSSYGRFDTSQAAIAGLLVDVTETLALLTVLEQHGEADDEQGVDSDHAKDGGEDVVEEAVGERGNGTDAATLQSGSGGGRAEVVGDEGGRGAVEVAAAFELYACQSRFTNPEFGSKGADNGQLTDSCIRLWTSDSESFQMSRNCSEVVRVRTQRKIPMDMVKRAQKAMSQPAILSQPRVGVMMPGRVRMKVAKMKAALAMPAEIR